MMVLGRVERIEAKRLFVRGIAEQAGVLAFADGSLRIYPDPAALDDLLALCNWRVVSLRYSTDRFQERLTEIGRRDRTGRAGDDRPFEHVFRTRPEFLWDPESETFVMPGVAMTYNQAGEPVMIAS